MERITKKILMLLMIGLLVVACKNNDDDDDDPNSLGGDPNVGYTEVGTTFSTSVRYLSNSYDLNENISVTKNDNGVVTLKVQADVSKLPSDVSNILRGIGVGVDNIGKINQEATLKVTTEGIQDYFFGPAFTLVKYNASVGDPYKLTTADGNTLTRTVVKKSTEDDFSWGFMLIKVVQVEQTGMGIPGVEKFVWSTNHKFGLVHFKAVLDDGSEVSSSIFQ